MQNAKILLLGVGNILYRDEGIGVHAAQHLEKGYNFSSNVTLYDGGTLGKLLMPYILDCDRLIVMDAVLGSREPGTIYRLQDDDLRKSLGFHDSQHQVDLVDVLISCDMVGSRPDAVVMGMEPKDWKTLGLELTEICQKQFEYFIECVLEELKASGGKARPKD